MSSYCTFTLQDQLFGLEIGHVQEVISPQDVTPVPLAPATCSGLINLRGQILLSLSMRRKLELPDAEPGSQAKTIILKCAEGLVGLQVDKMGDVVDVEQKRSEPLPFALQGTIRDLATEVFMLEDTLLVVLDPAKLAEA
jgi:purine-binding chemotaxis protein CheW